MKFLIFSLLALSLTACGGSGGGGETNVTQTPSIEITNPSDVVNDIIEPSGTGEPEWIGKHWVSFNRNVYVADLKLSGEMYVPEEIPVNQPMTKDNANSYERRTMYGSDRPTKYEYFWSDGKGKKRRYSSWAGENYAEFSSSLRTKRVKIYASRYKFIAWGPDGQEQMGCVLSWGEGESICSYEGTRYSFLNLQFPLVDIHPPEDVDHAVVMENFLLEMMGVDPSY